ncbi:calcium-binding protein [Nitrosomonas ureae]|uniref:Hemolysin-type calcium-binding repeat-containing protein n=1 Tax=Nitrosomonas ureae TaxID=44577 RepID=A0A1H9FH23_9PROT|nr:calcium-binding protein [Nitrosomonas ureae]SEQ37115.1 hypothetical protein SAMN05421510_10438 [Nitrosomonas ureae]
MATLLFHVNEIYSNADRSVQFIEFVGEADGQHEWAGEFINSGITDGGRGKVFPVTTDLSSSSTNGKFVLLATQRFADLGIVTPDYIIPEGYIEIENGYLGFSEIFHYSQLPIDGKFSLNSDLTIETNSPTNFAGESGTIDTLPDPTIIGTEGSDNLTGTDADNIFKAGGGQDIINGDLGDDALDGGSGIDTAVFSASFNVYEIISKSTVSGYFGNDLLISIERLQFSDKNLAIDLDVGQSANNTVRIIGAAFGAFTIHEHPEYVTIGLDLFDSGKSVLQATQLAIDAMGNLSNDDFVDTVFFNVVGASASVTEHDFYVSLLEGSGGSFTQAQLLDMAAMTELNADSINLIGLQQTGVEFS